MDNQRYITKHREKRIIKIRRIIEALTKKANDKLVKQCGYRPFVATYDSTILNDEWWKVFFGHFQELSHGIKQKNESILLQEEWIYRKKESGIGETENIEEVLDYLSKFI